MVKATSIHYVWFLVCLAFMGCAENGDATCVETVINEAHSANNEIVPTTNPLTYIQGPDDNATIPVVDVVLVSRVSEPRVWAISTLSFSQPMPHTMRFVARDEPGAQVLINRDDGTNVGAFDGNGRGWITVQRYDDGGGEGWNVVGWLGAVTIPGDP